MRKTSVVIAVALMACGDSGDFGATPGGVKDLRLARELVANGQVPPADALLVEAMFAEHDLGLEGAACEQELCVRAAAGLAPEIGGEARGWAQVGLSSTIDPDTWERPSTTFVFTVDVSGSMSWGDGSADNPTPAWLARKLMHEIADELRPDDKVAVVAYGSDVDVRLELTAGDSPRIHEVIDDLDEDGSTNMEAGMEKAYQIGGGSRGTAQTRVIVFSDTQPNVGETSGSGFAAMVQNAAAGGVDTTVLALGLGIGAEVMRGMASLRGANAFSLTRAEHVEELMADQWPWFTTPIAYGLRVDVTLGEGWGIDRGLGFPAVSDDEQLGLEAETVFLSKRKGALLVALTPLATSEPLRGEFALSYVTPDGTAVEGVAAFDASAAIPGETGQWFEQHSVARTTALALVTEAMHDAATIYAAMPAAALGVLQAARARFAADAAALGDADLAVEQQLVDAMTALVEQGAPQGSLYGY